MSNKNTFGLSPEHLRCLAGVSSYKAFYHFIKIFTTKGDDEKKRCPLCQPKSIPPQTETGGAPVAHRGPYPILYENAHWSVLNNVLATKRRCTASIIIAPHEHGEGFDWASMYAMMSFYGVLLWIIGHYSADIAKYGAMIYGRLGDPEHNIDTIPGHFHFSLIIPDGSGEVSVSVLKSAERQETDRTRAEEFFTRYEAGEVPK